MIPSGSTVMCVVSKDMGKLYRTYWCDICEELINSSDCSAEDEFPKGCFREAARARRVDRALRECGGTQ